MGERKVRMIGIDLDGTLLTGEKVLTEASRGALADAVRAGITVVPVTGRPLAGVPAEVLAIPGIRYIITSNGANTYDLAQWKVHAGRMDGDAGAFWAAHPMNADVLCAEPLPGTAVLRKAHLPHEAARRVLAAAAGEDVIREVFIKGVGYHDPGTQKMLERRFGVRPPILAYINRSRRVVGDAGELLSGSLPHVENISLMFQTQEARDAAFERLKRIRREDGEKILHVLLPWKTDLEVTHVLADKWLALRSLGARLGISGDEVMTLGDGDNDRPMLRGAGLGVAMGNAPSFVKETADLVTRDNEHDGAAAAIRAILGGPHQALKVCPMAIL